MRPASWIFAALAGAGLLAGCSGEGSSRQVIAETCSRDGGDKEMCACLASKSVKELDKPALEAVVLGAQGQDNEADRVMSAFTPEENLRFRNAMQGIVRSCGADAYISQQDAHAEPPK